VIENGKLTQTRNVSGQRKRTELLAHAEFARACVGLRKERLNLPRFAVEGVKIAIPGTLGKKKLFCAVSLPILAR